jgi:DNA-binding transcriptional MocR family regulator
VTDLKQYRIRAGSAAELVRDVEEAVAVGSLLAGQPLPSVRRLAAEVGLSPVTVAAGLAELRRRGVVVTEPRRGTRIGDGPPVVSWRAPLPVPPGARDLSRGNPDPALLPDLERAADDAQRLARDAVRGALDGIERVLEAHLRPGDRVAVENPGYAALFDLLRARGLSLEAVGVDERGMRAQELRDALARGASAVVITPRGQNPTGATLDATRARELRAVLASFPQTLVIEDDHLGLLAGSALHTTVAGRERWAATRSVAKALGPDLRLAVLAGDAHTIARVQGHQQCGPGWVSHILQRLVLSLWTDRAVQAQVARASAIYSARRERLIECLRENGLPALGASGLNVWIPVGDETGVVGAMLQRGWVLAPGAPYRLTGSPPAIRVTTATLLEAESQLLAGELAAVLAPARASRSG